MDRRPHVKRPNVRLSRDSVLFAAGLLGIANEALFNGAERPTLLILYAAMVGLPAFLAVDRHAAEHKPEPPPPPPVEPT